MGGGVFNLDFEFNLVPWSLKGLSPWGFKEGFFVKSEGLIEKLGKATKNKKELENLDLEWESEKLEFANIKKSSTEINIKVRSKI